MQITVNSFKEMTATEALEVRRDNAVGKYCIHDNESHSDLQDDEGKTLYFDSYDEASDYINSLSYDELT